MNFIIWIVIGGILGWLASIVMKTDAQQGIILNIVVGIIGAMIGGWLFQRFGHAGVTGMNFYSIFVATLGAILFLLSWPLKYLMHGVK